MKSFGLICLGWALTTAAQEWPKQRPITFVVTFPPGAIADTFARLAAQKVGESIGQIVVVENRPGATGNIAAQRVRRAAPDGYTILVASNAFAVNPSLFASAGYDPIDDFIPVILAGSMPSLIVSVILAKLEVESRAKVIVRAREAGLGRKTFR